MTDLSKLEAIVRARSKGVQIELASGGSALVSAEDEERVRAFRWSRSTKGSNLYPSASRKNENGRWEKFSLHRFVLNAKPGEIVDHIDRDPLNNTRDNLRIVTQKQNARNSYQKPRPDLPYKGVRKTPYGTFHAGSGMGGKIVCIGFYEKPEIAALRYDLHVFNIDPIFAALNFPKAIIEYIADLERRIGAENLATRICRAPGCGGSFVPNRDARIYCFSDDCQRARNREHYYRRADRFKKPESSP